MLDFHFLIHQRMKNEVLKLGRNYKFSWTKSICQWSKLTPCSFFRFCRFWKGYSRYLDDAVIHGIPIYWWQWCHLDFHLQGVQTFACLSTRFHLRKFFWTLCREMTSNGLKMRNIFCWLPTLVTINSKDFFPLRMEN